ncbi:MAG: efflux RND transporter periplasmic adaptor subunit, partial [Bacteroidia bacterium]|nr:efflux RND transporter periplasmic adaptor subunit [Bacteroidia bacterium]
GIINRIPYKRGSLVEEGTLLTTISDNNEMFAYFNVSEKEYLDYIISQSQQRPQDVTLMLVNGTPYSHSGKIETVESEFDASTGSIAFRVRFANPDGILKHGANGKIVVQQAVKNAIIIPQKSTFEIQDKLFVFVVNKDNKVEQRNIIPKMRIPHLYIVESGISKDERILFEGAQQLRSGDLIEPEPVGREDIALLIRPLR